MFGGQSINAFDYSMAEGVKKSFRRAIRDEVKRACAFCDVQAAGEIDFNVCTYSEGGNPAAVGNLTQIVGSADLAAKIYRQGGNSSGYGGFDSQLQHVAQQSGRASPVQLNQLRHGHKPRRPPGDSRSPERNRRRARQRRNTHIPDKRLPAQKRRQLQRRRPEL